MLHGPFQMLDKGAPVHQSGHRVMAHPVVAAAAVLDTIADIFGNMDGTDHLALQALNILEMKFVDWQAFALAVQGHLGHEVLPVKGPLLQALYHAPFVGEVGKQGFKVVAGPWFGAKGVSELFCPGSVEMIQVKAVYDIDNV